MVALVHSTASDSELSCQVSFGPPPGLTEVKVPTRTLTPPPGLEGLDACDDSEGVDDQEVGDQNAELLGTDCYDEVHGHLLQFPQAWMWGSSAEQLAEANNVPMDPAQAWWWHYGMMQYDLCEPISVISSESSPTGTGQWWQRGDAAWKDDSPRKIESSSDCAEEGGHSGATSTLEGSLRGTDEAPTSDDEELVILSDDGEDSELEDAELGGIVLEEDDWTVAGDLDQISDLCDFGEDGASTEAAGGACVEECIAEGGDCPQVQATSGGVVELASAEEPVVVQKPIIGWKQAPAEEMAASADAATALSTSDFPSLSMSQPRRRGSRR